MITAAMVSDIINVAMPYLAPWMPAEKPVNPIAATAKPVRKNITAAGNWYRNVVSCLSWMLFTSFSEATKRQAGSERSVDRRRLDTCHATVT